MLRRQTPLNRELEKLEAKMLEHPDAIHAKDLPLEHRFAPGVYMREIFMPAGAVILGHEHKTEHFNIVLSGRARVMMGGETQEIVGPCTFVSKPGVRKLLYILEDMRWQTIHPSKQTDVTKLEKKIVRKSKTWLKHEEKMKLLEDKV